MWLVVSWLVSCRGLGVAVPLKLTLLILILTVWVAVVYEWLKRLSASISVWLFGVNRPTPVVLYLVRLPLTQVVRPRCAFVSCLRLVTSCRPTRASVLLQTLGEVWRTVCSIWLGMGEGFGTVSMGWLVVKSTNDSDRTGW